MKLFGAQQPFFALIFFILIAAGCSGPVKMYYGPEKLPEELAAIIVSSPLQVMVKTGFEPNTIIGSKTTLRGQIAYLAPGRHRIVVFLRPEYYHSSYQTLKFHAEAGKRYKIKYERKKKFGVKNSFTWSASIEDISR